MSDEIDRAQARHEEWLADALRAQRRRQLLPGVRLCVECQHYQERLRK